MTSSPTLPTAPDGGSPLNPFLLIDDAAGFIDFAIAVFGLTEHEEARTPMPDGSLIHAELRVGSALLLIADPMPGWRAQPGLLQLWVDDVATVLDRGVEHGARIVTPATAFYGETTLGRLRDPWGNLWWLYSPTPGQPDPVPAWEGGDSTVFDTLDAELRAVAGT